MRYEGSSRRYQACAGTSRGMGFVRHGTSIAGWRKPRNAPRKTSGTEMQNHITISANCPRRPPPAARALSPGGVPRGRRVWFDAARAGGADQGADRDGARGLVGPDEDVEAEEDGCTHARVDHGGEQGHAHLVLLVEELGEARGDEAGGGAREQEQHDGAAEQRAAVRRREEAERREHEGEQRHEQQLDARRHVHRQQLRQLRRTEHVPVHKLPPSPHSAPRRAAAVQGRAGAHLPPGLLAQRLWVLRRVRVILLQVIAQHAAEDHPDDPRQEYLPARGPAINLGADSCSAAPPRGAPHRLRGWRAGIRG